MGPCFFLSVSVDDRLLGLQDTSQFRLRYLYDTSEPFRTELCPRDHRLLSGRDEARADHAAPCAHGRRIARARSLRPPRRRRRLLPRARAQPARGAPTEAERRVLAAGARPLLRARAGAAHNDEPLQALPPQPRTQLAAHERQLSAALRARRRGRGRERGPGITAAYVLANAYFLDVMRRRSLVGVRLGPAGALALADALTVQAVPSLETLDLSNNPRLQLNRLFIPHRAANAAAGSQQQTESQPQVHKVGELPVQRDLGQAETPYPVVENDYDNDGEGNEEADWEPMSDAGDPDSFASPVRGTRSSLPIYIDIRKAFDLQSVFEGSCSLERLPHVNSAVSPNWKVKCTVTGWNRGSSCPGIPWTF